jgi:hypothetical protein
LTIKSYTLVAAWESQISKSSGLVGIYCNSFHFEVHDFKVLKPSNQLPQFLPIQLAACIEGKLFL